MFSSPTLRRPWMTGSSNSSAPIPGFSRWGIGHHGDGYGFRVVKNAAKILPLSASISPPLSHIGNVPITIVNSHAELRHLVKVPASGPGSPGDASVIPEQGKHNPLVCGLQIHNFDDDFRQGDIANGFIIIGTLGCFVRTASGENAILWNNHVVAGQNRGVKLSDRILQPGGVLVGAGRSSRDAVRLCNVECQPCGCITRLRNGDFQRCGCGDCIPRCRCRFRPGLSHLACSSNPAEWEHRRLGRRPGLQSRPDLGLDSWDNHRRGDHRRANHLRLR